MAKIKKARIQLTTAVPSTPTTGYQFTQRSWDIPVTDLPKGQEADNAKALDAEMKEFVYAAFPKEYKSALDFQIYGELSAGGELKVGSTTLNVSFYEFDVA